MANRQEMMTSAARGELARAAQAFLDKFEVLSALEDMTELNTSVYEATDLCIEDAQAVLNALIQKIE